MEKKIRGKVLISKHARERFKERFPELNPKAFQGIASKARYVGHQDINFEGKFRSYLDSVTHKDNSKQIRVSNNKIFVFGGCDGHCRTLITLYPVPEQFSDYESFLINRKKNVN